MEIILFQATNIIRLGISTRELEHFGCIRITPTPLPPHALNLYVPVYILFSKKALPVDFTLRPSFGKSISKF